MGWVSRRATPPSFPAQWPSVSLIIPAYNESLIIAAKLENTLAIDYPFDKLEVILASDGSTDDTVTLAQRFDQISVKVLDLHPRRGKASVINDAVEASSGSVICLCDANVMFEPRALKQVISHLVDAQVGAVTGDVQLASERASFGAGESLYYRIERTVQTGESHLASTICVDGGMYVIRRELYQPLPEDTILDDFTTTMNVLRKGARVIYEPAAVAYENETPSASKEFDRRSRVMEGAVQALLRGHWPSLSQPLLVWEFVSHKLLRWLGPLLLLTVGASTVYLWNTSVIVRAVGLVQAASYSLAVLAAMVPLIRTLPLAGVVFYFVLSHVAMVHGFMMAFVRSPKGTWQRTPRVARAVSDARTGDQLVLTSSRSAE